MARLKSTRTSSGAESSRPHPLRLHASGNWCLKRKGRWFYFGRDEQAAIQRYLDGKAYYDVGRDPPEADGRLTLRELANRFLDHAQQRVDSGELSAATFRDYHRVAGEIIEALGKSAIVEDLRPDDFARLRDRLAKGRSLETLSNRITRARVVLKYAENTELIGGRIRFGKAFDKPARDKLRRERNARGPRDIPAEDVRKLIEAADPMVRVCVLLGIQAGFGPTDLAELPLSAVDLEGGWINWPRPKTGVNRRVPLWPESVAAVREYMERRPEPKREAADRLFVSRRRKAYRPESGVSSPFCTLRDACGLTCQFYDLRRTFRTVADETQDWPAIDAIMGHSDPSMGARYRQRVDDARLLAVTNHVRSWLFGEKGGAA